MIRAHVVEHLPDSVRIAITLRSEQWPMRILRLDAHGPVWEGRTAPRSP